MGSSSPRGAMFTFLQNILSGSSLLHYLPSVPSFQRLTNWFGNDWNYKDCSAAYSGEPNLLGVCNKLGDLKDSGAYGAGISQTTANAMKFSPSFAGAAVKNY